MLPRPRTSRAEPRLKRRPAGKFQSPVRCMHKLPRQFDGMAQNAAPSDNADEQLVPTPVDLRCPWCGARVFHGWCLGWCWALPTMPRTSSVSSGDGLNNGLPCRVRVVISTMALDVNYIHPTLGRCNCRSATMACSGTKRRDRGIPAYRQGTSDVASSADQPGRAAIKTPPCGEVPESCSMHAQ